MSNGMEVMFMAVARGLLLQNFISKHCGLHFPYIPIIRHSISIWVRKDMKTQGSETKTTLFFFRMLTWASKEMWRWSGPTDLAMAFSYSWMSMKHVERILFVSFFE